jgi:hypothetical protein
VIEKVLEQRELQKQPQRKSTAHKSLPHRTG